MLFRFIFFYMSNLTKIYRLLNTFFYTLLLSHIAIKLKLNIQLFLVKYKKNVIIS